MTTDERFEGNAQLSRYLVTDLDGTLLNRSQVMVPTSLAALNEFRRRGNEVILATGRSEQAALPFHRAMDLKTPAILYNGARVVDLASGTVLMERSLPADEHANLANVATKLDDRFVPVLFAGGSAYVDRRNPVSDAYARKDRIELHQIRSWQQVGMQQHTKWLFIGPEDEIANLADEIKHAVRSARVVQSERTYLEVLPPGTDKGVALQWLMEYLGIGRDHVVAIGDNLNDVELLRTAGIGLGVGDGHPKLRAAADRVVSACNEGAVADAVQLTLDILGRTVSADPSGG